MLRLSLRRAGNSTIWFGEPRWSVADGDDLTQEQVIDMTKGKKILVLVHGYRVTDSIDAYSRMVVNMAENGITYDYVIGVEWPGSQLVLGFMFASMRANKAGRRLYGALKDLHPNSIDIEGHSLGCRVVCSAIREGLCARLCVLAGAAIDHESVQSGEEFGYSLARCGKVLVAYSMRDDVLRGAYHASMFDTALGLKGPEDIKKCPLNIAVADLTEYVAAHSDYKRSAMFFHTWKSMLNVVGAPCAETEPR